jgi:hypothetical protein
MVVASACNSVGLDSLSTAKMVECNAVICLQTVGTGHSKTCEPQQNSVPIRMQVLSRPGPSTTHLLNVTSTVSTARGTHHCCLRKYSSLHAWQLDQFLQKLWGLTTVPGYE